MTVKRLERKTYYARLMTVEHRRGALHEAENCAGLGKSGAQTRLMTVDANSLLDWGYAHNNCVWLCKRCGNMR